MASLPRSAAKDIFSYLLAFSMLYVGVVSFLTLLFQYVNVLFPDALDQWHSGSLEVIRASMATLIVVWPVCVLMNRLIDKERLAEGSKADPDIRKFLIFLTLFAAAVTMVIDLITLINYFLNGELTVRFVLKVLAVLLTMGALFWFEFWDLKHTPAETAKGSKIVGALTAVIAVATVVGGFFLIGSPSEQRKMRLDDQRVNDLSNIQNEVTIYYQQKQLLPTSLSDLATDFNYYLPPGDPVSGAAYEYSVKNDLTFELCAIFETDSAEQPGVRGMMKSSSYPMMYDGYYSMMQNWTHAAGRVCFERTIDPEMYPPVK